MSDTATITDARIGFVRAKPFDPLPPPEAASGAVRWIRQNLFSSVTNVILTVCCVGMIAWLLPPLIEFFLVDAVWDGRAISDSALTSRIKSARKALGDDTWNTWTKLVAAARVA